MNTRNLNKIYIEKLIALQHHRHTVALVQKMSKTTPFNEGTHTGNEVENREKKCTSVRIMRIYLFFSETNNKTYTPKKELYLISREKKNEPKFELVVVAGFLLRV